jgi:uncharacterized membrane protein YsdA (DUF1294 family)
MFKVLAIVIILLNIAGFISAAIDKRRAIHKMWRIPEKVFFYISIFGGFPGVYISFIIFRHKTRHVKFMVGLPLIFIVQLIILFLTFRLL